MAEKASSSITFTYTRDWREGRVLKFVGRTPFENVLSPAAKKRNHFQKKWHHFKRWHHFHEQWHHFQQKWHHFEEKWHHLSFCSENSLKMA